eukprot:g4746.t1
MFCHAKTRKSGASRGGPLPTASQHLWSDQLVAWMQSYLQNFGLSLQKHYLEQEDENGIDRSDPQNLKKYGSKGPPAPRLLDHDDGWSGGQLHTWMIRDLPCRFRQEEVRAMLDLEFGLEGKYNFFYLPMDVRLRNKKAANRGYGFLNLKNREDSTFLKAVLHGKRLPGSESQKCCHLQPAKIQGLFANLLFYKNQFYNHDGGDPYHFTGSSACYSSSQQQLQQHHHHAMLPGANSQQHTTLTVKRKNEILFTLPAEKAVLEKAKEVEKRTRKGSTFSNCGFAPTVVTIKLPFVTSFLPRRMSRDKASGPRAGLAPQNNTTRMKAGSEEKGGAVVEGVDGFDTYNPGVVDEEEGEEEIEEIQHCGGAAGGETGFTKAGSLPTRLNYPPTVAFIPEFLLQDEGDPPSSLEDDEDVELREVIEQEKLAKKAFLLEELLKNLALNGLENLQEEDIVDVTTGNRVAPAAGGAPEVPLPTAEGDERLPSQPSSPLLGDGPPRPRGVEDLEVEDSCMGSSASVSSADSSCSAREYCGSSAAAAVLLPTSIAAPGGAGALTVQLEPPSSTSVQQQNKEKTAAQLGLLEIPGKKKRNSTGISRMPIPDQGEAAAEVALREKQKLPKVPKKFVYAHSEDEMDDACEGVGAAGRGGEKAIMSFFQNCGKNAIFAEPAGAAPPLKPGAVVGGSCIIGGAASATRGLVDRTFSSAVDTTGTGGLLVATDNGKNSARSSPTPVPVFGDAVSNSMQILGDGVVQQHPSPAAFAVGAADTSTKSKTRDHLPDDPREEEDAPLPAGGLMAEHSKNSTSEGEGDEDEHDELRPAPGSNSKSTTASSPAAVGSTSSSATPQDNCPASPPDGQGGQLALASLGAGGGTTSAALDEGDHIKLEISATGGARSTGGPLIRKPQTRREHVYCLGVGESGMEEYVKLTEIQLEELFFQPDTEKGTTTLKLDLTATLRLEVILYPLTGSGRYAIDAEKAKRTKRALEFLAITKKAACSEVDLPGPPEGGLFSAFVQRCKSLLSRPNEEEDEDGAKRNKKTKHERRSRSKKKRKTGKKEKDEDDLRGKKIKKRPDSDQAVHPLHGSYPYLHAKNELSLHEQIACAESYAGLMAVSSRPFLVYPERFFDSDVDFVKWSIGYMDTIRDHVVTEEEVSMGGSRVGGTASGGPPGPAIMEKTFPKLAADVLRDVEDPKLYAESLQRAQALQLHQYHSFGFGFGSLGTYHGGNSYNSTLERSSSAGVGGGNGNGYGKEQYGKYGTTAGGKYGKKPASGLNTPMSACSSKAGTAVAKGSSWAKPSSAMGASASAKQGEINQNKGTSTGSTYYSASATSSKNAKSTPYYSKDNHASYYGGYGTKPSHKGESWDAADGSKYYGEQGPAAAGGRSRSGSSGAEGYYNSYYHAGGSCSSSSKQDHFGSGSKGKKDHYHLQGTSYGSSHPGKDSGSWYNQQDHDASSPYYELHPPSSGEVRAGGAASDAGVGQEWSPGYDDNETYGASYGDPGLAYDYDYEDYVEHNKSSEDGTQQRLLSSSNSRWAEGGKHIGGKGKAKEYINHGYGGGDHHHEHSSSAKGGSKHGKHQVGSGKGKGVGPKGKTKNGKPAPPPPPGEKRSNREKGLSHRPVFR